MSTGNAVCGVLATEMICLFKKTWNRREDTDPKLTLFQPLEWTMKVDYVNIYGNICI